MLHYNNTCITKECNNDGQMPCCKKVYYIINYKVKLLIIQFVRSSYTFGAYFSLYNQGRHI